MTTPAPALNTASVSAALPASAQELFALTDEQILDIQLHDEDATLKSGATTEAQNSMSAAEHGPRSTEQWPQSASHESPITGHDSAEPPPWLARQMNDPWSGEEARELWNGVQQARYEAAAYRAALATPEEARALKDLYPGGVEQARTTAERARALEEIDTAFFGGAGKSAQEISAGRVALAERMLREDPTAFREMVFAGLRALEATGQNPVQAQIPAPEKTPDLVALRFSGASSHGNEARSDARPMPAPTSEARDIPHTNPAAEAQLAAYRSFEKTANEELERSVGGAIQRSLEQALPVAQANLPVRGHGTQTRSPALQERLAAAIRDDVESALKSDQQLGEQLSRVLASRRFDETSRAQVVRLINGRAQQLVPVAARRVIQEWTQTAFASRGKGLNVAAGFSPASGDASVLSANDASAASPRSLASTFAAPPQSRPAGTADSSRSAHRASATSPKAAAANRAERDAGLTPRPAARPSGRAVDYNRLTDEQILEM
jgi:hypothetical protein